MQHQTQPPKGPANNKTYGFERERQVISNLLSLQRELLVNIWSEKTGEPAKQSTGNTNDKEKESQREPLRWFGYLTPPALKQAQKEYERGMQLNQQGYPIDLIREWMWSIKQLCVVVVWSSASVFFYGCVRKS